MSNDPNVELLNRAYEDWRRGDFTRNDMFHPEVEFVTYLPRRSYHGHAGVTEGWFDFLAAWNDFTVEAREIIRGKGSRNLVLVHLRGRGKESGLPIESEGANVVELRDGKIVLFELHWDRDEALAGAGLDTAP
jgi:ketosteroid isomerase-like protein